MLLEFYFYFYTVSCQSHKQLDKGAADNERPLQVRSIYNDNVRVKTMKYKLVLYKMHLGPLLVQQVMVLCHKLILKSVSYPKIVKNTSILMDQTIACNVYT